MPGHLLLEGLDLGAAPASSFVIEVGSVREPGPLPSSLYLDRKATEAGLNFLTVDNSETSWKLTREYVGDKAILADGERFLEGFTEAISVLYLDNFDYPVDESHFKDICRRSGHDFGGSNCRTVQRQSVQRQSVQVHFEQLLTVLPKLTSTFWVVVDNTGRTALHQRLFRPLPGQGSLCSVVFDQEWIFHR